MNMTSSFPCQSTAQFNAIKFDKSLIDGYQCSVCGCENLVGDCKECTFNTNTPYIRINDTIYFIVDWKSTVLHTTGFGVNSDFYIVFNKNKPNAQPMFVSAAEFSKQFKAC